MSKDLFPTGLWVGFYNYKAGGPKHYMTLQLKFVNGCIDGSGIDDVGFFTVQGAYDIDSLECKWVKNYKSHKVYYRGFREGRGIWGVWEIPELSRHGGFHIWPVERTALPVMPDTNDHDKECSPKLFLPPPSKNQPSQPPAF